MDLRNLGRQDRGSGRTPCADGNRSTSLPHREMLAEQLAATLGARRVPGDVGNAMGHQWSSGWTTGGEGETEWSWRGTTPCRMPSETSNARMLSLCASRQSSSRMQAQRGMQTEVCGVGDCADGTTAGRTRATTCSGAVGSQATCATPSVGEDFAGAVGAGNSSSSPA